MTTRNVATLLFILMVFHDSIADYRCICNYNVEQAVFPMTTISSTPIGYVYEFDCKERLMFIGLQGEWLAIAFEHKVGYIQLNSGIQQLTCAGDPSTDDTVTTTASTPLAYTATTKLLVTVDAHGHGHGGQTGIHTNTNSHHVTNPQSQSPGFTVYSTATSIYPTLQTGATTVATIVSSASSGGTSGLTLVHTTIHPTLRPVPTTMSRTTSTAAPPTTTFGPVISGNLSLCPDILKKYTMEDEGALTQYGDRCYELVPTNVIWTKAELDCRAKDGHLIQIANEATQHFIVRWLGKFNFLYPIWIGLNDKDKDDQFTWISAPYNSVRYTSWFQHHVTAGRHVDDVCVVLRPGSTFSGGWENVDCGETFPSGDTGQQNAFICEYSTTTQAIVVG